MKKIFVILMCLMLWGCSVNSEYSVDLNNINVLDYSDATTFDFAINSNEYMLVDLSNFKVQYAYGNDKKIYPASLTKLMTLDVVLNTFEDLSAVSYINNAQIAELIEEDASLAYIKANYNYTLKELLYGLMLPSGADAAIALENYFKRNGLNLIEEMSKQLDRLGCDNTHFVNSTGLHDDEHYTTLDDLLKILMDVLSFKEGRDILETTAYRTQDNIMFLSGIKRIRANGVKVLGGKTGYTPEAGQNVIVLYRVNNHSYALFLSNAYADYYKDVTLHFDDAMEIMAHLY